MFSSTSTSSGNSASGSTSTSRTACASTSTSSSKVAGNTCFVCFVNSDLRYVFSLCSTIYFTICFNSMSLFTITTRYVQVFEKNFLQFCGCSLLSFMALCLVLIPGQSLFVWYQRFGTPAIFGFLFFSFLSRI